MKRGVTNQSILGLVRCSYDFPVCGHQCDNIGDVLEQHAPRYCIFFRFVPLRLGVYGGILEQTGNILDRSFVKFRIGLQLIIVSSFFSMRGS